MLTIAGGVALGIFVVIVVVRLWPLIWRLAVLAGLAGALAWLLFGGARQIVEAIPAGIKDPLGWALGLMGLGWIAYCCLTEFMERRANSADRPESFDR